MEESNKTDTKKKFFSSPLTIAVVAVVVLVVLLLLVVVLQQGTQLRTTITSASPRPPEPEPSTIEIEIRAIREQVVEGENADYTLRYRTRGPEVFDPSRTDIIFTNIVSHDSTAVMGEDYALPETAPHQAVILAGLSSTTVPVSTIDDNLPEPTKEFSLGFADPRNVNQTSVFFVDTVTGNTTRIEDLFDNYYYSDVYANTVIYDDDENLHYTVQVRNLSPDSVIINLVRMWGVLEGDSPQDNKVLEFEVVLIDSNGILINVGQLVNGLPPGMTVSTSPASFHGNFDNSNEQQYTPLNGFPVNVNFVGNQAVGANVDVRVASDIIHDDIGNLIVFLELHDVRGRRMSYSAAVIIDDDLPPSPAPSPSSPSPSPQ